MQSLLAKSLPQIRPDVVLGAADVLSTACEAQQMAKQVAFDGLSYMRGVAHARPASC